VPDEVIDARNRLDAVLAEVRRIVNQPATAYPMTDDLRAKVTVYPAGWFQPGADVPGFATVDIQATQILTYAQDEWVTSNLTPGVAFRGEDLEFNSMTKFFYTDRSLPKRKLTQAEMRRVNALYRQIATYSSELQRFGHPWTPSPGSPAP
jgi:hypothetical protein